MHVEFLAFTVDWMVSNSMDPHVHVYTCTYIHVHVCTQLLKLAGTVKGPQYETDLFDIL